MSPRRRSDGPEKLHTGLEAVMAELATEAPAATVSVFSHWQAIAGDAVAQHVVPLRIRDGALVVAVDNPVWATQVRALSAALLERVAAVTDEQLDHIEVTVTRR
jgi:predicted nucleic acid-binding Zn ribbon protein